MSIVVKLLEIFSKNSLGKIFFSWDLGWVGEFGASERGLGRVELRRASSLEKLFLRS